MNTAWEAADMAKLKDARDGHIMEAMMEQFWRYAPDDKYEAGCFAKDFHMLVRQIYREAQEPVFKQLEAIMRAMPMPNFLGPLGDK